MAKHAKKDKYLRINLRFNLKKIILNYILVLKIFNLVNFFKYFIKLILNFEN